MTITLKLKETTEPSIFESLKNWEKLVNNEQLKFKKRSYWNNFHKARKYFKKYQKTKDTKTFYLWTKYSIRCKSLYPVEIKTEETSNVLGEQQHDITFNY